MHRFVLALSLATALFLVGCSSPSYQFRRARGGTGVVQWGHAAPPAEAPSVVQAAIAAGNRISGMPYRRGGGHAHEIDSAYDCSGSVSFVLREAGLLHDSMPSGGFRTYGKSGE